MADFWVFAYGSLMWRPDFAFAQAVPARLNGAHRALCVYSFVHRGTPQHPGLVLGLDRGGSCRGIAYHVGKENGDSVLAYLRARELVTDAYRETQRLVLLEPPPATMVTATAFVVNRAHAQYAGMLSPEAQFAIVASAFGRSGPNSEYVVNTVAHLRALGIRDPGLEWLSERLAAPQAARLAER